MRITLLSSLLLNIFISCKLYFLHKSTQKQNISNAQNLAFQKKMKMRSLTHLTITFNDFSKVQSLIQNHWTQFPPCLNSTNVTLVLEHAGFRHPINITEIESHPTVKNCFKKVQVVFANTPNHYNNHDDGSRVLLERIIDNYILLDDPYYVLNIETDVYPIKPYWLNYLETICNGGFGRENWWILGSLYMGNLNLDLIKRGFYELGFHISGNAIFNVSPDSGLKNFYFGQFKEYQRMGHSIKNYPTYDVAVSEMLMNVNVTWNWVRHMAHKIQYSEYIMNWYGRYFSFKRDSPKYPRTFLVHKARFTKKNSKNVH